MAIDEDGNVWVWGLNDNDRLGIDFMDEVNKAVKLGLGF